MRGGGKAWVLRSECVTVGALGVVEKQDQLLLNPFEHQVSMQVKRRVDEKGMRYLSGESTDTFGFFSLLETADGVTGYISLADYLYRVEPAEKGLHRILEIDRRLFIPEETAPDYPQSDAVSFSNLIPLSPSAKTTRTTPARIDVLVAYTDDVAAEYDLTTEILPEIELARQMANTTYSNSDVNLELNVVHKVLITFNETGDYETDLDAFMARADISNLRNQYNADVCVIIVASGGGGRAYKFHVDASEAYCLAGFVDVAARYTLAHEIGHLIGAYHQIEAWNFPGYQHGHRCYPESGYEVQYQFHTVMAVPEDVKKYGHIPRIPYYSDPQRLHLGVVPMGVADTSQNARYLNEEGPRLSDFRVAPPVVQISGPASRNAYQSGAWTCEIISDGQSPFHYQWYCRYPELNLKDNDTKKPPSGYWFTLGYDSPTLTRSDDESFDLKCEVTDALQYIVTTPVFSVSIGGGLAKRIVEADLDTGLPRRNYLYVNYPNPFNPSTSIRYEVAEQRHVSLLVFNAAGQCVASLVDRVIEPGAYQVGFNADGLASGIYYCRINAGDYSSVRKMIYIK